ncbi:hypothetical protein CLOSTASPAR_02775 [[Clostridium] asparagiforme DSM 15981]|uniref:Uncharacterized protein n=1 Tax=[Clostridium] asparagiforme DSM 15981 TaxID=518636 RepID=C0D0I9_9FIRM|nr:hypothetical protein CLOSTASPAR_02775 [[Clostridium] asparagiforme DSM 15981]
MKYGDRYEGAGRRPLAASGVVIRGGIWYTGFQRMNGTKG